MTPVHDVCVRTLMAISLNYNPLDLVVVHFSLCLGYSFSMAVLRIQSLLLCGLDLFSLNTHANMLYSFTHKHV
jgi:hypothetical protein